MAEKEYVDSDSPYSSVEITAGASNQEIVNYSCKNGAKPFLLSFRNAVGPGGEPYITFTLLLNGVPMKDFDRIQNQIAAPENQQGQLVIRRELPQGSFLKVIASNSDGSTAYNATAKMEIAYEAL